MELSTNRAEAKLRSQSQYITGKPCRNGHTTYRYTSSGACSGCIREANGSVYDENTALKKRAKHDLVLIRCRLFDTDRETFALSVWASVAMRYPMLELGDVDQRLLPSDRTAGTALYKFNCHADDVEALRALANDLCRSHKLDVEGTRQKAIQSAAGYLPPDSTPPINFK